MLKRPPLYDMHKGLGAKMVEFAGWEMPVQYTGIVAEHRAVRERVGLFDLSHMGEIDVHGPRALELCQRLTVNDIAPLSNDHAQYAVLCHARGGIVDDVVIYRRREHWYFFCVNAVNTDKDVQWMQEHCGAGAEVRDRSADYVLLALQGPRAHDTLQKLTAASLSLLRKFQTVEAKVAGVPTLVSRTGYTGEDGFELFFPAAQAARVWEACLIAGQQWDILPAGLGARDTLRIEAGYPLYGNEITSEITPLEAGLERLVKFHKGEFIGREALLQQKSAGVQKKLIGLAMADRGIPRKGYALFSHGTVIGEVTSGTMSPTLNKAVGLGYVVPSFPQEATMVDVNIRGRQARAEIVPLPFYRRARPGTVPT